MGGVWSFLTKIRELVEALTVAALLLTPSAMSAANLDILLGSVAEDEAMGGVEALALAVVGVQAMGMHAGEFNENILIKVLKLYSDRI